MFCHLRCFRFLKSSAAPAFFARTNEKTPVLQPGAKTGRCGLGVWCVFASLFVCNRLSYPALEQSLDPYGFASLLFNRFAKRSGVVYSRQHFASDLEQNLHSVLVVLVKLEISRLVLYLL